MTKELEKLTIKTAAEEFKNRRLKATELVNFYLQKIQRLNPKINAYNTVLEKEALEQAAESDKRFEEGKSKGLLDGMPIALKDNISLEGVKTTASSKILANYLPVYDASVVSKLKAAGAIILGKTNLDEFAMGSSTETSFWGPTKNPFDRERVSGGSSGGSAAAVAGGMALGALGSDTGGSIRQPASFCGVVGFKPTYGAVSRYGLLAMASSLDQIGPIAKTAEDAEIMFETISGQDPKDSTSIKSEILNPKSLPRRQAGETNSKFEIQNIKIGVPKEYFGQGLNPEVRRIVEKAIDGFGRLGAEIQEISLPNQKYALSCYYIIMPVEVASNLARYDGIKYGYSEIRNPKSETRNLLEIYIKTRSEGFGKETKRRILLGTYASSAGYVDQYYNQAQRVRALVKKDFDEAFSEVDFLMGPVSPEVAFKIGAKSDPLTMYLSDIYTIAVNLAGLPAISVPAGFSSLNQKNPTPGVGLNGLPVGLQIIGPQFGDLEVLNLAKIYEGERDGLSSASIS